MGKRPASRSSEHQHLQQALETLKNLKLRRTQPREILLEFLIREHGPFSVEEIFRSLKRRDLDLVTVYRCVAAFEKIGLVRRCDFGDGVSRYEYQSDPAHHHHHVICTDCRKTENLESCDLPDFESQVKKMGYSNIRHTLEFFGLCRDCKSRSA